MSGSAWRRRLGRVGRAVLQAGRPGRQEGQVSRVEHGRDLVKQLEREGRRVERGHRVGRILQQLRQRRGLWRRESDLGRRQMRRVRHLARVHELVRVDEVRHRVDRGQSRLLGGRAFVAGRAVGMDDASGEKICHVFARLGHIGRVDVVERAILADEHDHVLDRRDGVGPGIVAGQGGSRTSSGGDGQLTARCHAERDERDHRNHREPSLSSNVH